MKCPYCGEEISKKDTFIKNTIQGLGTRSYYHVKCHELAQTTPKNEWPNKIKQAEDKEGEIQLWAEIIYDYILKVQRITPNFVLIKKQLENYVSPKFGYKHKGVYLSVKYFYEVKRRLGEDKSNGGIGIVPYVYDEAKDYWERKVVKDNNTIKEIEKQIKELSKKTIKKVPYGQKERKKKNEISLSSVLEMEDDE